MKKSLIVGALALPFAALAQDISKQDLSKIRSTYEQDNYTVAMQNALSNNDVSDLAFRRSKIGEEDHEFTYKVDVKGITNQKSSGRCWMFTSLNMLRPKVMNKLELSEFEFSENYLYFWDIFEKANLYLNNMVETAEQPIDDRLVQWYVSTPVSDGGMWINFVNLVDKYGMVPKSVMEETNSSSNTRWMVKMINLKLKEDGLKLRDMVNSGAKAKVITESKNQMMADVYRMLSLNLGEPPVEFEWRYKNTSGDLSEYKAYTPESFSEMVLGDLNLHDYVMLMNDPTRPYGVHYEIQNYRNVEEGENWHYVNLDNETIKQFCIESIKNNEAMYTSSDVGQQLKRDYGVLDVDNFDFDAIYNLEFGMDKKERIQTKASGSSHAMLLMAVDINGEGESTKWQFENSWGTAAGHNGYLTFTDAWFKEFMFRIVVHKDFVDQKVQDIYNEESTKLPAWDWMF